MIHKVVLDTRCATLEISSTKAKSFCVWLGHSEMHDSPCKDQASEAWFAYFAQSNGNRSTHVMS